MADYAENVPDEKSEQSDYESDADMGLPVPPPTPFWARGAAASQTATARSATLEPRPRIPKRERSPSLPRRAFSPVPSPDPSVGAPPAVVQAQREPSLVIMDEPAQPSRAIRLRSPVVKRSPSRGVREASVVIADSPPPRGSPHGGPARGEGSRAARRSASRDVVDITDINDTNEVLDPRGDLTLVAGEQKREFRVCSRTLDRSSPTFERLTREMDQYRYDNTSVAPPPQRKLQLPEVNAEALHIILLIIHGRTTQVQNRMTKGNMMLFSDVLVVAHHFDMVSCLAPVAVKWIKSVYDKDCMRWDELAPQIYITYTLGYLKGLKRSIFNAVLVGRLNQNGQLIGLGAGDGETFCNFKPLLSLDILDSITICRATVMERIVGMVDDALHRLIHAPRIASLQPICQGASKRERCDAIMLGSFQRALAYDDWENRDMRCSPKRLYEKIKMASKKAVEWAEGAASHQECNPFGGHMTPLEDIITEALESIPFSKEDFARRAKTCGFDRVDQPW